MKKVRAKMTLKKLAEEMKRGFKRADSNLAKLAGTVDSLAISVAKGFASVDERFEAMDKKFTERFDKVDATMEHNRAELSSRLTSVEKRVAVLEDR